MGVQFPSVLWPAVRDGVTRLGQRYFNPIWELIDARLAVLEDTKASYETEAEKFTTIGLDRLNQVLGPSFLRLGRIAELGFLKANSTTPETLVVDEISTFVIDDLDQRELFHPSAFVTITRPNSQSDFAIGKVAAYVKTTGILDVEIKLIVGSAGPHASWEIITGSGVTLYMKALADAAKADRMAADAAAAAAIEAKNLTNAAALLIAGGPVSSVNGQTGAVTLTAALVGAMSSAAGTALVQTVNTTLVEFEAEVAADLAAAAAAQSTALTNGLATKEPIWRAPAAYNAGQALDRQHIVATANLALDLATLNPPIGAHFRVQTTTAATLVTLTGAGQRFRNKAGVFVAEAFIVNLPAAVHEFIKVSATDWELA